MKNELTNKEQNLLAEISNLLGETYRTIGRTENSIAAREIIGLFAKQYHQTDNKSVDFYNEFLKYIQKNHQKTYESIYLNGQSVNLLHIVDSFCKQFIQYHPKAISEVESDSWINIIDKKPLAYETGNWDGKRSDLFLGQCKHGVYYIAVMYEGFLDGNNFCDFYDKNDYEIRDLIKWKPITD